MPEIPLPLLACLQRAGVTQAQLDEAIECYDTPPEPPPSPGFAACGGQGFRGIDGWSDWCVRDTSKFDTFANGVLTMERASKAMRVRLPGAAPRGVAPPTVGTNRVLMDCELAFDQGWIDPAVLGGQHLFALGQGPFILANGQESPDHLRLDFSPGRYPDVSGVGFRHGFRCQVYEKRAGQRRERWMNFEEPNAWTAAGTFRRFMVRTDQPDDGTLRVIVTFDGSDPMTRTIDLWRGQPMHVGDALEWGNFDTRPGRCYLRNLSYAPF